MEKKRNLPPESSQLVEPPLKQHKSEAEQAFGASCSPAFRSSMRRSSSTPAFGSSSSTSFGDFELFSTRPFEQTNSAFGSSMRRSSSIPVFGSSSSTSFGGFGQKPAFGGIRPFGSTMPTFVRKLLEEVRNQMQLEAIQTAEQAAFGATSTPAVGATSTLPFGMRRLTFGEPRTPFSIVSLPAITEEDGGTSGQTAKLESISAIPAYNYERYESCFAIAGADYCVIAADFTRGHTKTSELSRKSVMASCGFQADVEALREALSAENLRYECERNKPMSCPEMHRLLFDFQECHPNHDFIVLGGLDSEAKGCVFEHFGPGAATFVSEVGHPGSRLTVPPILKYKLPAKDVLARLSETEAVDLAKAVFKSATNTGDKLEIVVLNAGGLERYLVDLRKDCP